MKTFNRLVASALLATLSTTAVFADSTSNQTQEELTQMALQEFATDYVQLWRTTDSAERATLASKLFAENAVHYAAPANVTFDGREAILANVTSINEQAIQGAGLKFIGGVSVPNGNGILIEWSAEAPNGKTVRTGRDILILNDEGKASTLYMFTSD